VSSAADLGPRSAACGRAHAREVWVSTGFEAASTGVEAEDVVVGDERDATVAIRIYRPSPHEGPLPTLLYSHATGVGSSTDTDGAHELARALAARSGAAVALPSHSPGAALPQRTAVQRCQAALKWMARHGHGRGLDGRRLAVGGDGAGAAVAVALAALVREHRGPPVASQLLLCPHLDRTPLGIEHLPPTLVITAERDALCDAGEAYAARLRTAGVNVIAVRYQDVGAGFMRANPPSDQPHPSTAAIDQAARFLSDTLRRCQRASG
jgi:acetyl esterase/lipase